MDQEQPQTTLREVLETNIEAAEAGTLPTVEEVAQRARDEAGRFARKEVEPKAEAPKVEAPAVPPVAAPAVPIRPTTWKKEYLPIWDKLATGQALNPDEAKKLAEYTQQRENEYKTGVSTYKAEAMQAKELQEAVTPFIAEMQASGINPAALIKANLQAHYTLHKGTPEQKLAVLQEIARQFNVPVQLLGQQQQQMPPLVTELLGRIDQLQQQVSGVTSWRQQQETDRLMGEISKVADDSAKYPYFEQCRETMAQLLESGLAQDLPTAYAKAEWMVDEVRELKQQQAATVTNQHAAVAKAKARAVSPKSSTPSGSVTTGATKDRRAALEDAMESITGGRV